MSAEDNEAILRRYFEEAGNQGRITVLDELVAPAMVKKQQMQCIPRHRMGALPHSRCIKIDEPPVTATSFSVGTDAHTSVASHARFARSGGQEPRIRHHRECGRAPMS